MNPIPYLKRLTAVFQHRWSSDWSYYPAPKCWFSRVYANLIRVVRSLWCRDEVDPMPSEILISNLNESSMEDIVKRLNNNFHNLSIKQGDLIIVGRLSNSKVPKDKPQVLLNGSFGSKVSPEIVREWNLIGERLCSALHRKYDNSIENFQSSLNAFKTAKIQTSKYKDRYFSYIHEEYHSKFDLEFNKIIEITENSLELNRRISLSFLIFFKNVSKSPKPLNQVKSINKHINYLINYVIDFVFDKEFSKTSIDQLINMIDGVCDPSVLNQIYTISVKKKEKYAFESGCEELKKNCKTIDSYSKYLKKVVSSQDFEDDELEANPDSAEGRAIKRLEDIESGHQIKWIPHTKADSFSSEEEFESWLIARGSL